MVLGYYQPDAVAAGDTAAAGTLPAAAAEADHGPADVAAAATAMAVAGRIEGGTAEPESCAPAAGGVVSSELDKSPRTQP